MKANKLIKTVLLVLIINVVYAVGNFLLGVSHKSWWFITLGIYYMILSVLRLSVVMIGDRINGRLVSKYVGIMLMVTALPLLVIVILSFIKDRGNKFHEIVMIAMALYAFTKITLAILNLIKARKGGTQTESALRNISFADALVSIASLQRSMLVSFGDMAESEIRLFNVLTGTGVSIIIFLLGMWLFGAFSHKEK